MFLNPSIPAFMLYPRPNHTSTKQSRILNKWYKCAESSDQATCPSRGP